MEPYRNLRVLPSNAPALPEGTNSQLSTPEESDDGLSSQICQSFNHGLQCYSCRQLHVCQFCKRQDHGAGVCKARILQVSSGNSGANIFATRPIESKSEDYQNYVFKAGSFPVSAPLQSVPATLKWEQPSRNRKSTERQPNYWHIEFSTPRYRAYREKCRQKGSNEGLKWPDRIEEAFQIALRVYGRRGRKQEVLGGKMSGGNEWISHYILKTTGVTRCRKQVGSHIQVLKKYLEENLEWMSLVADIKPERSRKKHRNNAPQETGACSGESNDSDDAVNYQISHARHRAYSGSLLQPAEQSGPTIRSVRFLMALWSREDQIMHTFSSLQSEVGSAPKVLHEIGDWRAMFPHLAAYHEDGDTQTPTFLFEANLSLMNKLPPRGSQVGTELLFDFTRGAEYNDWCCLTRFYENGGQEIDLEQYYERSRLPESDYNALGCYPNPKNGDMRLKDIPLKSKWWATKFSEIMGITEDAEVRANKSGNPQLVRDVADNHRRYVSELSAMQELRAVPRGVEGAKSQRMALILWRFNQTRRGESATTSWRRIVPPVSPFQVQSPTSTMMQPHMTLDTALEEARLQPPVLAAPDYYDSSHFQPGVFMDDSGGLLAARLSEESSPDTIQSPDYHSFPSTSTTTSFPSSVSNSIYPVHPSQEPSYQSHVSGYPIFGSFDSQGSSYEVVAHSQEAYESQDSNYHSQDAIYHHVGTPLYGYPPQHPDDPSSATASHDFTGGEIQLDYEAPLIAPRANMIPQPQLIQHLEQFDHHDPLDEYRDELSHEQQHLQEIYPEQFEHSIDFNLLATQFNAWEDQLRTYPEVEREIKQKGMDSTSQMRESHIESKGQGPLEVDTAVIRQGKVLGEFQEGEVPLEKRFEHD